MGCGEKLCKRKWDLGSLSFLHIHEYDNNELTVRKLKEKRIRNIEGRRQIKVVEEEE